MPRERPILGYAVAAAAAAGLLGSLWAPWYHFQIPEAALNSAVQSAQQFGILGPIVSQGASLLRELGPLPVTAWQAFTFTPAVLLVVGVVAGGLALLTLTERAVGVGGMIAGAGACGVAMAGYRVVDRPGPSEFVHPAWGLYLALGCAGAVLVGGLIARAAEDWGATIPARASEEVPGPSASWTASSVAPPTKIECP
jgi:hypothetical protein